MYNAESARAFHQIATEIRNSGHAVFFPSQRSISPTRRSKFGPLRQSTREGPSFYSNKNLKLAVKRQFRRVRWPEHGCSSATARHFEQAELVRDEPESLASRTFALGPRVPLRRLARCGCRSQPGAVVESRLLPHRREVSLRLRRKTRA